MQKFIIALFIVLLANCKNETNKTKEVNIKKNEISVLQASDIENLKFSDYALDRNAQKKINNWLKYNELESLISQVKRADFGHFKSDQEVVKSLFDELETTLPESITTNAIKARILVLKNMYYKLNSEVNLGTTTKSDLKLATTEFLVSFSNLNFQINKKFERDAQNIVKP